MNTLHYYFVRFDAIKATSGGRKHILQQVNRKLATITAMLKRKMINNNKIKRSLLIVYISHFGL